MGCVLGPQLGSGRIDRCYIHGDNTSNVRRGVVGTLALAAYTPGYVFTNNVLEGELGGNAYPPNTFNPPGWSTVAFVNYSNGNGGDYRLCRGAGIPAPPAPVQAPAQMLELIPLQFRPRLRSRLTAGHLTWVRGSV